MVDDQSDGPEYDLSSEILRDESTPLEQRARFFGNVLRQMQANERIRYHRVISTTADREVLVRDVRSDQTRQMLMFGSNNYLGLANHPHILKRVIETVNQFGTGIGGVPFFNGYTKISQELEERIADRMEKEATLLFSSGYTANIAIVDGIMQATDFLAYDEYSHASLFDGVRIAQPRARRFRHNSTEHLQSILCSGRTDGARDVFVAVEGVYSMDGDIAPLDDILRICRRNNATLIVDDAHATGVLGSTGYGSGEHFQIASDIDVLMGTFSKAFAVNGAFVCATRDIVDYMRFFSRSYMFSSAMPPQTIAAIDGALDVLENEPSLIANLRSNVGYAAERLNALDWNFDIVPQSPILVLKTPPTMDIKGASNLIHEAGVFVNAIEFPAVPYESQRFRLSLMATHTKSDIDQLVETIDYVWSEHARGRPELQARVATA